MKLLAIVTALLACFTHRSAQALPYVPSGAQVLNITYDGVGCPGGSVGHTSFGSSTGFTLIFDSLIAHADVNASIADATSSCNIAISLAVPSGWYLTAPQIQVRGFVELPPGGLAYLIQSHRFSPTDSEEHLDTALRFKSLPDPLPEASTCDRSPIRYRRLQAASRARAAEARPSPSWRFRQQSASSCRPGLSAKSPSTLRTAVFQAMCRAKGHSHTCSPRRLSFTTPSCPVSFRS
ncbi:uncharacterized protein BJ171DRAFT_502032 [Polychytrium aggregatum]|uniref:uncharacterized protein n=1 Tax=Polychytrium aggregatum TaxID=110093 RepID=UPI0022FE45BD|nr:uncharacterized protein BJ171DRAFT_502032 [Polychytrium aggregatum]KAI9205408.1 hypothetical protein BJ171DRAFT_502032 [Polychytrium aggregatum]